MRYVLHLLVLHTLIFGFSSSAQTGMNANFHEQLMAYPVTAMEASGDTAYFANGDILISADISDPENVVYLDSIIIGNGMTQPSGMAIIDNYLFLSTYHDGMYIYTVKDPRDMHCVDTLTMLPAGQLISVYSYNDILFIMDGVEIFIYTIDSTHSLSYKSAFTGFSTFFSVVLGPGIVAQDSSLYYSSNGEMFFGRLNKSGDFTSVETVPSVLLGATRFIFQGAYLYVNSGHKLYTYERMNEGEFSLIDIDETELEICNLQVADNVLYAISAGAGELFCFDISNPADPVLIAQWGNSRITPFRYMFIKDEYVFIGTEVSPGLFTVKTDFPPVGTEHIATPASFSLSPVYPNPFSGNTTITYSLPVQQHISLDVYNSLGRKVQTLYNGLREPGTHTARLDASALPAGTYRVALRSAEGVKTQMVVVR